MLSQSEKLLGSDDALSGLWRTKQQCLETNGLAKCFMIFRNESQDFLPHAVALYWKTLSHHQIPAAEKLLLLPGGCAV